METFVMAMIVKPFFAVVLFTFIFLLAALIYRYMPDSKLKRILFAPLPGHKARDWSAFARRNRR